MEFKEITKTFSGPLKIRLWARYIFSSYNARIIFKSGSCLKHIRDPKVNQFF